MKTIHKFRLEPGKEPTTLSLREGYRVVRSEYIVPHKAVYLWVEQPLNVTTPTLERRFRVVYSGEPVPDRFEYVDTALDPFGPEAYHVFAVPADEDSATFSPTGEGASNDAFTRRNWQPTAIS
ncbi:MULTISPECIES: hypothetical protein [Marinobacter]|uniref:DUF7352 domain-containing protein n=1 Tax=Marinobacter metalliresistant TaxID=2961995 RepID=A0ABZ2W2K1_9GAMM|nr:hypothetical protein [Marinobacter sp. Arc7-DN-1]AXS81774.1 hypothetical protein D0851_01095 [Marinobacter sp. Arc7-DN-1]